MMLLAYTNAFVLSWANPRNGMKEQKTHFQFAMCQIESWWTECHQMYLGLYAKANGVWMQKNEILPILTTGIDLHVMTWTMRKGMGKMRHWVILRISSSMSTKTNFKFTVTYSVLNRLAKYKWLNGLSRTNTNGQTSGRNCPPNRHTILHTSVSSSTSSFLITANKKKIQLRTGAKWH